VGAGERCGSRNRSRPDRRCAGIDAQAVAPRERSSPEVAPGSPPTRSRPSARVARPPGPPRSAERSRVAWPPGASKLLVRPIVNMTHAAERMSMGELDSSIPSAGKNELGMLAKALERLRRSMIAAPTWGAAVTACRRRRCRDRRRSGSSPSGRARRGARR
jgi:hypothetical protein